eukprot:CAMPEP_0177224554 /NCGR_PEP_ID=MMETSP0367-20130122/39084_1 /TAXON_ID=447022 ORGANISM="Scrippsiella hangoei-like, Strain SHHI-4" /NCGR_SAMPLE_ID=MMETSP0367 /ASSEMBLY_ACC=CAM_ASM_000362 /LENGTH=37 /DNA_ID= /DNA_START= /DNA_END= /DNA_ORIENTATION=
MRPHCQIHANGACAEWQAVIVTRRRKSAMLVTMKPQW